MFVRAVIRQRLSIGQQPSDIHSAANDCSNHRIHCTSNVPQRCGGEGRQNIPKATIWVQRGPETTKKEMSRTPAPKTKMIRSVFDRRLQHVTGARSTKAKTCHRFGTGPCQPCLRNQPPKQPYAKHSNCGPPQQQCGHWPSVTSLLPLCRVSAAHVAKSGVTYFKAASCTSLANRQSLLFGV